jgi:peptidase A4-like protein
LSRSISRRIHLATSVAASAVVIVAPLALSATAAAPSVAAGSFGPSVTFGSPLHRVGGDIISNWGGYVAHGATFTVAQASWRIADVSCLHQSDLYAPWVGIDGDGTQTVEQTGVQTDCHTGAPTHKAWYEMYPAAPVYYPDPISTGDKFTASVTASGTSFTLKITDNTKGWTESVTKVLGSAQKATAEAVIEAPGGYPDISRVHFFDVTFNGQPLDSFSDLRKYDTQSGSATIYSPTRIKHHTDFKMKPIN